MLEVSLYQQHSKETAGCQGLYPTMTLSLASSSRVLIVASLLHQKSTELIPFFRSKKPSF